MRKGGDWILKFFSLATATVLYFFVAVQSETPVEVDFPIQFRLPEDVTLTGDSPNTVHVTLQGPWATFRAFSPTELQAVSIDLSEAGPGPIERQIDTTDIPSPIGMRVLSVRPSKIQLMLERMMERQIPIRVDIRDRPAYGYEIVDVHSDPAKARVVGPVSQVQSLDAIYTRALSIAEREDDVSTDVDLRPVAAPLVLKDLQTKVLIDIGEEFVERRLGDVTIRMDNAPKGTRTVPDHVPVNVKGPRRIVDKLAPDLVVAFVDVAEDAELGHGAFEKNVEFELPDRTLLIGAPPKVLVQLPKSTKVQIKKK